MGQKLSAAVLPDGAAATYQWKRGDANDGNFSDISGANSVSYTLQAEDEGKYIKVEAAGTGKYSGTVASDVTAAIETAG